MSLEERFQNMTGNTKVWRAPLAGLASVAMIATMGVAASTANAATEVTVKLDAGEYGSVATTTVADEDIEKEGVQLSNLYTNKYKVTLNEDNGNKVFTGWYTQDGKQAVDPGSTYKDDVTLYAHYATTQGDEEYQVTFKNAATYATGSGTADFIVNDGTDVSVYLKSGDQLAGWEVPSKQADSFDGYFGGWSLDGKTKVDDYSALKPGDELVALVSAKFDTYSLDDQTGANNILWSDGSKGTTLKVPTGSNAPTAYYFDGVGAQKVTAWTDAHTPKTTVPAYLVKVTAVDVDAKTAISDAYGTSYAYFDEVPALSALSAFEKTDGYQFYGWYKSFDASTGVSAELQYETLATLFGKQHDVDVYAAFTASEETVKVTFDENWDNGSKSTATFKRSAYLGDGLPTPTRDGYVFAGWYTDPVNGGQMTKDTKVSAFAPSGVKATLYAHWTNAKYAELYQLLTFNNTGEIYTVASYNKYAETRNDVLKKAGLTAPIALDKVKALKDAAIDDYVKTLTAAKAGLVLVPDAEGLFTDVNKLTPHYADILTLGKQGVIRGYADGSFSPATGMTRADFAAYLYRLAGEPDYTVDASDNAFTDVTAATPHYKEILWAAKNGILKGYADGTFGWSALVNRQDAAAFLYRLAGSPNYNAATSKSSFTDVDSSTPHYKEILWAADNGIAFGYSDGTFNGGATILRQDASALLNRAVVADRLK